MTKTALFRGLFILTSLLALGLNVLAADETKDSVLVNRDVTASDMRFFFDSISFEHGKWKFELSRNSMGMLWRTINGKDDVTGVCSYKQTLVVPMSSSLELKTQDMAISFQPEALEPFDNERAGFIVIKRIGASSGFSNGGATSLEIDRTGKWSVIRGED